MNSFYLIQIKKDQFVIIVRATYFALFTRVHLAFATRLYLKQCDQFINAFHPWV